MVKAVPVVRKHGKAYTERRVCENPTNNIGSGHRDIVEAPTLL